MGSMKTLCGICVLLIGVGTGCGVDDDLYRLRKTQWTPEVVLPIAHAHLPVNRLLSKENSEAISVDEEQRVTLSYSAELYTKSGKEILRLLDHTFPLNGGLNKYEMDLVENGILQFVELSEGELYLYLLENSRQDIAQIEVRIPSIHVNGEPIHFTKVNVSEFDTIINLAGAEINLTNGENNTIEAEVLIRDGSGNDLSDDYSLYFTIRNLVIKTAKGWFDDLILDFNRDTIELEIFKNWRGGEVFLDDPEIEISFENSIGIPFSGSIGTFDAKIDQEGATVIPINYSSAIGNEFVIDFPKGDDVIGYANSIFKLTKENSNLENVIRVSPKELYYDFNLVARHDVNTDEVGYISDTSRLSVSTNLRLPFTGRIDDVIVMDTIWISNATFKEMNKLESATLEIETENALPLGVDVQLFFINNQFEILDSVFTSREFLSPAEVDFSGNVSSSSKVTNSIQTDKERLSRLKNAKAVIVYGKLDTSENGSETVNFQSTNYLDVNLKLKSRIQIL